MTLTMYAYRCTICGEEVEQDFKTGAAPAEIWGYCSCTKEHEVPFRRVYRIAGLVFKGPGFYSTDNSKSPLKRLPPSRVAKEFR